MDYSGVQIGAVLVGRYRVERVIGRGGMGIVVQATHLQLHQPVAMKFLLPEVLGNQQVVQRFLREAQAAVRLRSEHVARVIDVGTLETGAPYMVLEYLEGSDLANFPRAQLSIGGVIDMMLQACEALAEAHSLGIVHRDIKPANFFITRGADGSALLKVLDFGISKTAMSNAQLTGTQSVMGTPAYMSPEQMRSSRDVDLRSDIWSLGIVMYELLQGVPPFGGDTFSSMVLKVVNDPLPRMSVRLPGDLDAIVYRCLEKDPTRRFQNIAELAQAIAKYAQSETQAAISVQRTNSIVGTSPPRAAVDPGTGQRNVPSTISGAVGARTVPPGRRHWPIFATLGVVVAAVVAIAIVASSGGGSGSGNNPEVPAARPDGKAAPEASPPAPVAQPAAPVPAAPPPVAAVPPDAAPAPPATPAVAVPATQPDTQAAAPAVPGKTSPGPETVAPPPGTPGKKPKPSKPTPGKPEGKPQAPTDDDVLGTRK